MSDALNTLLTFPNQSFYNHCQTKKTNKPGSVCCCGSGSDDSVLGVGFTFARLVPFVTPGAFLACCVVTVAALLDVQPILVYLDSNFVLV